jgi:hypothetical protein
MAPKMEKPACGARAVPESDLAGGSIDSETYVTLRKLQARHLTRRCAVSMATAIALVPLLHGDAA